MIARYTNASQRTYLSDALGSVIGQAREDQSIQNWYSYSPYGEGTATVDDEGNSSEYTARENDGTGLYYYQARRTVDMLNLVYHDTQDEKVYQVLSRRMKDRYDILGGLPDTIEDDWTESVEKLEEMMDEYIHLRQKARDVFEMRYQESIDPDKDRWKLCSRVLARRGVVDRLSSPW